MKGFLKAVVRVLGWPIRLPFNEWFRQLGRRVEDAEGTTAQRITEARWSIEEVVARETNVVQGEVHRKIDDVEARLDAKLHALQRAVVANGETTVEVSRAAARATERAWDDLRTGIARAGADSAIWPLVGRPLAELPEAAAHLVNWANSAIGMAGEGGVFVNNGLNLQFHAGGAGVVEVSERIVELPFANGIAAQLPRGSHVLDVGARESALALELASLGHRAVALDPRGYPFAHPNLTVVDRPAEDWDGPAAPFDAIFCISTIEHLGLGAYVDSSGVDDLDLTVMKRLRSWVGAGGRCALTVPYGTWAVDDFQRVYDDDHLDRLVEGWTVARSETYRRVDACTWEPHDGSPWGDAPPGVALLVLQP